jgi:hypothetical protein
MKGEFSATTAGLLMLKREAGRKGMTLSNYMRHCAGLPTLKRGRRVEQSASDKQSTAPQPLGSRSFTNVQPFESVGRDQVRDFVTVPVDE